MGSVWSVRSVFAALEVRFAKLEVWFRTMENKLDSQAPVATEEPPSLTPVSFSTL